MEHDTDSKGKPRSNPPSPQHLHESKVGLVWYQAQHEHDSIAEAQLEAHALAVFIIQAGIRVREAKPFVSVGQRKYDLS